MDIDFWITIRERGNRLKIKNVSLKFTETSWKMFDSQEANVEWC